MLRVESQTMNNGYCSELLLSIEGLYYNTVSILGVFTFLNSVSFQCRHDH